MFGTTNFPFNFVNRNGIPLIESSNITVNDDNVTITIANRAFRWLNQKGIILFRLNQVIPEGSDSLPILFSSNDFTQPLTLVGGVAATEEQLEGIGVYLIYYDKDANLFQLLTNGIGTEQTNSNT